MEENAEKVVGDSIKWGNKTGITESGGGGEHHSKKQGPIGREEQVTISLILM